MLAQPDIVLFDVVQQLLVGFFPGRGVLLAAIIHRLGQVGILQARAFDMLELIAGGGLFRRVPPALRPGDKVLGVGVAKGSQDLGADIGWWRRCPGFFTSFSNSVI